MYIQVMNPYSPVLAPEMKQEDQELKVILG